MSDLDRLLWEAFRAGWVARGGDPDSDLCRSDFRLWRESLS